MVTKRETPEVKSEGRAVAALLITSTSESRAEMCVVGWRCFE